MRILHTSDWHLGQNFMGKSRQAEHQALIAWLLAQVQQQAVDAVLIAGDIFDTGAPPSYAREMYSDLVVRLHAAGVGLLLLAGNHDSVATLRESRELLSVLDTHVYPAATEPQSHVRVLPSRVAGQAGCIVCAIPFIRPRDVVTSEFGQSAQDRQQQLLAAIKQYYQSVYDVACAKRDELMQRTGQRLPIIATGHLTTVGASSSESVREIYVGTLEAFPTSEFPPVDYLALGHIHKPQKVGGLEHIRYSGSPIALSFDELGQHKQMLLVDLDESGLQAATELPVPVFQPMMSVRGDLGYISETLPRLAAQAEAGKTVWLEITVTTDDYLADLPARIQKLVEGQPLEVLRIRRERGQTMAQLFDNSGVTLDELDPHDVFERRLSLEEGMDVALRSAMSQRYRQIVDKVVTGDAHGDGEGAQ
ncbi:exonuclease subunit SbcD [Diaphorobacter sp. HDW4A]|uniref:exonuclease subunit SbcD n=1 Tax=Diaphorobacter sp. HDW4A TaxID=2714924 RepID=UPI001409D71A|nr:exonuclease subunit SbcD [Diaphorobacter sp. HDW4A]QIL81653.1 exonuclease subunit SbcD [Diaphorobacter sp. HDW4A]